MRWPPRSGGPAENMGRRSRKRAPKRAIIRYVQSRWQSVVSDLRFRCSRAGSISCSHFRSPTTTAPSTTHSSSRTSDGRRHSASSSATHARSGRASSTGCTPARAGSMRTIARYIGQIVLKALQPLAHRWEVRFGHEPPPRQVSMRGSRTSLASPISRRVTSTCTPYSGRQ